MFSDVWVDVIRQAHAEVPESAGVWSSGRAGEGAGDLAGRRLLPAGLPGPSADFPSELAPLVGELAEAQRKCPWEC
jgi:hypothetical protein